MSKDSLRAFADTVQGEKYRKEGFVRKRKVWRSPGRRKHTQPLNDGEMIVFICSSRWHVSPDCRHVEMGEYCNRSGNRHILKRSCVRGGAGGNGLFVVRLPVPRDVSLMYCNVAMEAALGTSETPLIIIWRLAVV